MIHDEKTTEIEIPIKLPSKVTPLQKTEAVPVKAEIQNTVPMTAGVPSSTLARAAQSHTNSIFRSAIGLGHSRKKASLEWIRSMDVTEPWLLRLIAVLTILLLSILIL